MSVETDNALKTAKTEAQSPFRKPLGFLVKLFEIVYNHPWKSAATVLTVIGLADQTFAEAKGAQFIGEYVTKPIRDAFFVSAADRQRDAERRAEVEKIAKRFKDGTKAESESVAAIEQSAAELRADPNATVATSDELNEATQTQAGRDALAQKLFAEATEKAAANPAAATTTADGYKNLTPPVMVDHVLQAKNGSPLRVVRIDDNTLPAGTTVSENGTLLGKCATDCLALEIPADKLQEGKLVITSDGSTETIWIDATAVERARAAATTP
jgi:hypothetical protein